ncbi:MAG: UDP-glucuronic acid decarboxylase family protein [Candidatus Levyibacteriota bacterium]
MTVLVAGGAGFIGSHLCEKLLSKGYKVFSLDNLITGEKNNLDNLISNPSFEFIEKDITKDFADVKDKLKDVEFIFHMASPASPNKKSARSYMSHPIETLLVNSLGTYNLLRLAQDLKAKFLFASSSEVYGDPSVSPQREDYFGNVNPNGVRSVYDEGKRFGEAITMGFVRKYDIDARIIRIFNTYGPKMQKDDGRVVSNFINQALTGMPITVYGEGKQTRSLCFISDMIEGIAAAMFTNGTKGEVINLGNPNEKTILEIAEMIKEMTGSSSQISFEALGQDDPKKRNPDISKAKSLLSFNPSVDLRDGLKKTIEYFSSQEQSARGGKTL